MRSQQADSSLMTFTTDRLLIERSDSATDRPRPTPRRCFLTMISRTQSGILDPLWQRSPRDERKHAPDATPFLCAEREELAILTERWRYLLFNYSAVIPRNYRAANDPNFHVPRGATRHGATLPGQTQTGIAVSPWTLGIVDT